MSGLLLQQLALAQQQGFAAAQQKLYGGYGQAALGQGIAGYYADRQRLSSRLGEPSTIDKMEFDVKALLDGWDSP